LHPKTFLAPCVAAIGTVGALLGAPWSVSPAGAQDPPPAFVKVDAVRQEPMSQTIRVIGRLVAVQTGLVAARVAGPVADVLVDVGDRVEAGDVLAILSTERLSAERAVREAAVRIAGAKVHTAREEAKLFRQELKRLNSLKKSAAFSQARFDDKRQEVAMAEGEIAQAEAELAREKATLELVEIDLDRALIRAPFPGVVSQRHIAAGNYVGVGEKAMTLINDRDLEVEAEVPSVRLRGLVRGTAIEIELDDGTRHRAAVRAIVPEENPLTRTQPVRFTPSFGETLKPLAANQSVTVLLPIGVGRQVVSVHKDAVINRQGKQIVFVVEDQAAQLRALRLGEQVGGRFEVLDGVKPGDLVIVRGNERLRPGQRVRFERSS
jgi:RND family efflux transporter MFP subunit